MASGSHVPLDGSNVTESKISSTRVPTSLPSVVSFVPTSPLIGTYALLDLGASLLDEWQGELDRKDSEGPLPSGIPRFASSSHTPIEGDPPRSNLDIDARPSAPTLSSIPTLSPKSPARPDHRAKSMSHSIFLSSFPQKLDPRSDTSDTNIAQNTQSSTETATPSDSGTQLQTSILYEPSPNATTHFPEILPFSRMFSKANQEVLPSSSKESPSSSRLEKGQHAGLRPWPRVSMWSHTSPVLPSTGETNSTESPASPVVASPRDSPRQRRLSADVSAAEAFGSRGSWQRGVTEELLRLSEGRDPLSRSSSRRTTRVASVYSRSRLSSVREFRHNREDTLDADHARRHRALSDGENGTFRRSSVSSLRKQLGLSGKLSIARGGGPNVLRDGLNIGGAIRVSTFRRGSLPVYTKPAPASELDGPPAVAEGESDLVPGEVVPPLTRTAPPGRLTDISDTLKTVGSHSHKARHHSLPSTVPSNASALSTNRPHRISTVNFASLEPSTGKRKERGGDHDSEEFVPTSVRSVSPPATLPRGILKSPPPMMPSAFTDLSSDRQSKRLKLSLSSPPLAADFFGEPGSSSRRSLPRLSENNSQPLEQHTDFQETPSLPSQPSFGAQSSTVVSHSGPPASYSPSFSSTRVSSSQNGHRRTSISSRLTSGDAPIPMRAFLSPRPPSIAGNQLSEYHMQDPSLHLRYSKTEQSELAPRHIEVLRWWQKPSIHGWCFILGFVFPPLWWAGAFLLRPRGVVLSRLKDNDLIEEWNDQDQVALTWRFRCRLMSLFSLLIYTPIIVLAIIFG